MMTNNQILSQISGYNIEEHDNPADFFLDVILGDKESGQEPEETEVTLTHEKDRDVMVINMNKVADVTETGIESGEKVNQKFEICVEKQPPVSIMLF